MTSSEHPPPSELYVFLDRLAAGGMAEVYLGKLQGGGGFEKPVAIKRIHEESPAGQAALDALIEEAKLSVSLCHPNIVQTLDLAYVAGSYVLVMEHVEGFDLQRVIDMLRQAGRLFPIDLSAYVVRELCRGLDHAHQVVDGQGRPAGIVHRDVSPQNVLLSLAGEVKIADFGIAKTRLCRSDSEARVVKGKYFYMSPEQASAEPLDHRTDVFSAGIVLWELLAGRRLHQARDVASLLGAVRRAQVPRPSALRAGVPAELDAIVARATAHARQARYPDAGAMADALTAYLSGRPPIHATRQIGELLSELPSAQLATSSPVVMPIPDTRDRAVTLSLQERPTPHEPPLHHDLGDGRLTGRPTVAGWRSPEPRASRNAAWPLVLAVGSLLVALLARSLYGS